MGMNFPNSPTSNQVFTAPNGAQYVYLNGVWMQVSAAQTLVTAQARNRVVNPAMQISQEVGTGGTLTNQGYVVDQWQAQVYGVVFGATKTNALAHQIGINITTGKTLTATDYLGFSQPIEGLRVWDFLYGSANAQPSVLRFDVFSPIAATFGIAIRNGTSNRSFLAPFTITTPSVWTTINIPIPGDTTGTWATDTASGMNIAIMFACGTSFQGVAGWQAGNFLAPTGVNNVLTTGHSFFLRNVGLHLDPDNTGVPPPWVMPDEAEELRACQRYWQKTSNYFSGNVTASALYYCVYSFPVQCRAAPAVSGVNVTNGNFPATPGTFAGASLPNQATENRTASATGGGTFGTIVTANARM